MTSGLPGCFNDFHHFQCLLVGHWNFFCPEEVQDHVREIGVEVPVIALQPGAMKLNSAQG